MKVTEPSEHESHQALLLGLVQQIELMSPLVDEHGHDLRLNASYIAARNKLGLTSDVPRGDGAL
jgi:hypothetical protein